MSILNGFKQEGRSGAPKSRFKMSVLDTVKIFHFDLDSNVILLVSFTDVDVLFADIKQIV